MVSVQINVISTIFLPFGDYRFPQTSHFLQPTMTTLYRSLQPQPAEWPAGATAFEGAFLKLSDKVQGRPMTSGNWLTQQSWFPAGTCGSRDCSQSCARRTPPAARRGLFVLTSSLPLHTTRHASPAGASCPPGSLTTDTVHGLPTLRRPGRLGERPPLHWLLCLWAPR